MIEQTDEEKRQMFQELLEIVDHRTREQFPQPNITAKEYARLRGITMGAAYRRLEKQVQMGKLKKECGVLIGDHSSCIYWKA